MTQTRHPFTLSISLMAVGLFKVSLNGEFPVMLVIMVNAFELPPQATSSTMLLKQCIHQLSRDIRRSHNDCFRVRTSRQKAHFWSVASVD